MKNFLVFLYIVPRYSDPLVFSKGFFYYKVGFILPVHSLLTITLLSLCWKYLRDFILYPTDFIPVTLYSRLSLSFWLIVPQTSLSVFGLVHFGIFSSFYNYKNKHVFVSLPILFLFVEIGWAEIGQEEIGWVLFVELVYT